MKTRRRNWKSLPRLNGACFFQTGVCILVYSNCGDLGKATVTSRAFLKNAHGSHLGSERHVLPFYILRAPRYAIIAIL